METYAKALLIAIPFFISLVLVEALYGHLSGKQTYRFMDTISSLSSGLTNIIKDSLGLVVVIVTYPYLLEALSLQQLPNAWWVYVVAFIAIDFAGYWNHRLSHRVNIFWNQHVIHHSSEEFNLACALRQSISNVIGYFPLLLIPAALLGVPEEVINLLAPIQLFLQFWYHTRHIGKLGWLEYLIVTPSQHRVHHAINPEYIDKNLGQIFSVWDRLFGTFQEELEEVPPVYGVLKPAQTWNPVLINFQHLWRITQDAWRTRNFKDKLRIWFMPTGWRPEDVKEKYPIRIIEDVYDFEKYYSRNDAVTKVYALLQMSIATSLLLMMLYHYGTIELPNLLLFGAFVFLGVYAYTAVMDGVQQGYWMELLRTGWILLLWASNGTWFGLKDIYPWFPYILTFYVVLSAVSAIYLSRSARYSPWNSNISKPSLSTSEP